MKLRYTGPQATTFRQPPVGTVEPGAEFEVRDEDVLRFMRRADIEHAGECPAPPCRCGDEPSPEPAADPEPETAAPRPRKTARTSDDGGEPSSSPAGGAE